MAHEQAILDGLLPAEASLATAKRGRGRGHGHDRRPWPFAEYVATWAATAGGSYETRQTRASHARMLATAFPDVAVANIGPADVRRWLATM